MVKLLWLQMIFNMRRIHAWALDVAYERYCRRQWRQGRIALSFELWRRG